MANPDGITAPRHSRTVAGIELVFVKPGNYSYRDSDIIRVKKNFVNPKRMKGKTLSYNYTVWMVVQTLEEYDSLADAARAVKAYVDSQFAQRSAHQEVHEVSAKMDKVLSRRGASRRSQQTTNRTGVTR